MVDLQRLREELRKYMRPIREIRYSSHFVRAVKKLPRHIADHCEEREEIFRKNCFDPRLKTHKLHGRFYEHWSFSITHAYRIVFRFLTPDTVLFVDTDDHSIYQ